MIPRIDAARLAAGDVVMLEALRRGVKEAGFLTLTNTGFTREEMAQVFDAYRAFFHLPEAEKAAVDMARTGSNRGWGGPQSEQVDPMANPDYKEVFDCGLTLGADAPADLRAMTVYGANQWPEKPAHFQDVIRAYRDRAMGVARDLLRGIATAMGQDPDYFDQRFDRPMVLLRGNYYPPRPDWAGDKDFGIAAHTDYGCLTLLAADGTPGLEVQMQDGSWEAVNAAPPDFVVNSGEMLEMWTGGEVRATLHRVRGSADERISVPLFFNPNHDANVAPMGSGDVIRAGDHLTKRFEETYIHLKAS